VSVFVIAEAGVNHNGQLDRAFQMIDVAVDSGADAVKFQTFKTEKLVTHDAPLAMYQKKSLSNIKSSQYSMLKELELSHQDHYKLVDYCKEKGIGFLSTPFDEESLSFLINELNIDILKIASGDMTNAPLVMKCAQAGKKMIISTGMSDINEIRDTLGIVAFGMINNTKSRPTKEDFIEAYVSKEGRNALKKNVSLLHCTSEYPAPFSEINLKAMHSIREAFGLQVGYSDHSQGISIPIAAAAIGASIIEKHFTMDRTLPGPDHLSSLEPAELKDMIDSIRNIEKAMGSAVKEVQNSELLNKKVSRKSLVANMDISQGEVFNEINLSVKRPGSGVSPMEYWSLLGKKSKKSYRKDEQIIL